MFRDIHLAIAIDTVGMKSVQFGNNAVQVHTLTGTPIVVHAADAVADQLAEDDAIDVYEAIKRGAEHWGWSVEETTFWFVHDLRRTLIPAGLVGKRGPSNPVLAP